MGRKLGTFDAGNGFDGHRCTMKKNGWGWGGEEGRNGRVVGEVVTECS